MAETFDRELDPSDIAPAVFEWDEMEAGDSITSAEIQDLNPTGKVTLSAPQIVGSEVRFTASGGSIGKHTLECVVTTSKGYRFRDVAILPVVVRK